MAKIIDLQNEINDMIDGFIDLKYECIRTIEKLTNPLQYSVIHMHYVEYKTLSDIATEKGYAYQYIIEVHSAALNELQKYI
ncbi:MAG: hypothetical protein PUB43_02540 [Oscillospiraceae bacterium]|nr:hypothetical protein [Oscillospiraceae bacterium]